MLKKITLLLPILVFLFAASQAQTVKVTLSGILRDGNNKSLLPYVNIALKHANDSSLVAGTIAGEQGRFVIEGIPSGNYIISYSYIGYQPKNQPLLVGQLNNFLDLGIIELAPDAQSLTEVTVTGRQEPIAAKMDKKTFTLANNLTQSGGSVLEAMKNLPGITTQDGKVQLRGATR
ncbi:carboxypeptidase-like regulatory domain-containing protein [Paraflavitalea speifideaquila]|uniref:carboxypeptidase-like regulatory domain-containing protein n=1 Tax=Paraflavitalea speifideaquila TaxID=3076558 RepID=UPI0028E37350|nr:carboxypeptidase-like regulatory domain-containing protein [Paraflavitalea speifideiaquila]